MCRLFGLVANKEVDINFSMLEASRSFKALGKDNPHGWGIGWYDNKGKLKIEKYGESAFVSERFNNLVKEIYSSIAIAHVRYASNGDKTDRNAHPFIYDKWIFAHNGTVNKDRLLKLLYSPYNQNFTIKPIDSEIYFRFLLQKIEEKDDIFEGIKDAVKEVTEDDTGANFLLSNGYSLWAYRHGRELYYLIRDPDKSLYDSSKETGALIESKRLNQEKAILICSEKLTDNESWKEIAEDTIISIGKNLKCELFKV